MKLSGCSDTHLQSQLPWKVRQADNLNPEFRPAWRVDQDPTAKRKKKKQNLISLVTKQETQSVGTCSHFPWASSFTKTALQQEQAARDGD